MSHRALLLSLGFGLLLISPLRADDAPAKVLLGDGAAGWEAEVGPNSPSGAPQPDVTLATGKDGVTVSVQAAGTSGFPGITLKPAAPWDLSAYGRIDGTVTNTGAKPIRLSLRVDDATGESGVATVLVKPGETQTLPVYLATASSKARLKSSAMASLILFGGKAADAQSFRIEKIVAAGVPGEKPPLDPKTFVSTPDHGVLWGAGVTLDAAKQLGITGGAKASVDAENAALKLDFGGAGDAVLLKPAMGTWNLNEYFEIRVKVKNGGASPVTPSVRVESKDGPTATIAAAAPVAPGESAEIVVPFAAQTPWEGVDDPAMSDPEKKASFQGKPGTGTKFVSHRVTGVTVLGGGSGSLLVTSVAGENPASPDLPEWIGQRPPVDGEWTKTFEDNFDGTAIDLTKWNIYCPNFWDTRTHFSKDNVIVKDGTLTLRVEKKTGHHNDDPNGKVTDYATGYADTYGKWTQRYGYFEARVKLPKAPCLWPAFWLMPDRGIKTGDQGHRQSTRNGGMELDVIEQLSVFGSQRFNLAFHWDGYGKTHKDTGTGTNYVAADKDGYIVVGVLWTPGSLVLYGNGKEFAEWKSPRISNVTSNILLDNVTGGWETETLDDAQLPGDFVVDYVRVWQRKDLVSPEDGPKPNQGTPAAPTQ